MGLTSSKAGTMRALTMASVSRPAQAWTRQRTPPAPEPERCSAGEPDRPPALTQRQREVLELLGDGLTVQAIAHRLYLSPRTVGKHLERIYRRLGTCDRLTTVICAQRHGLLAGPARSSSRG